MPKLNKYSCRNITQHTEPEEIEAAYPELAAQFCAEGTQASAGDKIAVGGLVYWVEVQYVIRQQ